MTIARPAGGYGAGVFGLLRELRMRLGSGFVLPFVSADGVVDRSRPMPTRPSCGTSGTPWYASASTPPTRITTQGTRCARGPLQLRPTSSRCTSPRAQLGSSTSTGSSRTTAQASAIEGAFPGPSPRRPGEGRGVPSPRRRCGSWRLQRCWFVGWLRLGLAPTGGSSLVLSLSPMNQ